MNFSDLFMETVETVNGKAQIRRVRTSFIHLCGFLFFPLGVYLVLSHDKLFSVGVFFVTFLAPCFLLYPLVRFFVSGGKDSVASVVTTVVVEEVTKGVIKDMISGPKKKKKRY